MEKPLPLLPALDIKCWTAGWVDGAHLSMQKKTAFKHARNQLLPEEYWEKDSS